MRQPPSPSVKLSGTEEPVEPPRLLTAGPLYGRARMPAICATFVIDGIEMIRAVSLHRPRQELGHLRSRDLRSRGRARRATASGHLRCGDARCGAAIALFRADQGDAAGKLDFIAEGEAVTDFLTDRTGFVVLHPIDGVAGAPVEVEHGGRSGRRARAFPS